MRRYPWILTLTMTLAVACGDDKNTTTEATTDGSTTDATSTSSTSTTSPTSTDPSGTMGGSQTMGETSDATTIGPSTTTDATSTTEPDTTGGSTTGGGNADIPGACKALCAKGVTECMIAEIGMSVDECALGCVNDLGGPMGACAEATVAYLECITALDCAALEDAVINENLDLCLDAAIAIGMACQDNTCTVGINGNEMQNECSVTVECPNMPLQVMQCAGKQCVCLVDGQKVGMCMADDICMTPDALDQKAADCCGF